MTIPYSELTKHFTEEDRKLVAKGSKRLDVKIRISQVIGEELLRENSELCDLLCEAELDFSDKELLRSVADQVAAVKGTTREFTPAQLERLEELTAEVHRWIAEAESVKV